jgi:hypothetical protein
VTPGRRDLRLVAVALWAALAVGLGLVAWRVLTACAVAWPGGAPILSYCPPPPEPDPDLAVLAEESERRRALEDELARLRLALVDAPACEPPEEEPEEEIAEEESPEEPPEEPPVEEPPEEIEVAQIPPEPPPEPPEIPRMPDRRPTPPPPPPPPEPEPEPPPPPPEPEPEPEPPPPPPGPVEQCDTEVSAAGRHNDRRHVNLGTEPGRVTIEYNHFRVPDRIEVWYHGLLLASTPGMVGGRSQISFNWQPQFNDPYVEVVVVANRMFPTRWVYRVNCPR